MLTLEGLLARRADTKLQTCAAVCPHSPFDASGRQKQTLEAFGIFLRLQASGCEVLLKVREQSDIVLVQKSLIIVVSGSSTPRAWHGCARET